MYDLGPPEISFIIVILAVTIFDLWMFISMLRNRSLTHGSKLIWCVAMLVFTLGAAGYYFFTVYRKQRESPAW